LIEQLTGVYDERQEQLQAMVVELRSTLEAGGATSDSVRETVAALDALMAGFERRAASATGSTARPFDVTEYTEALRQLGEAAQQLQALLSQADSKAPSLAQVSDRAAGSLATLVDQVYWRLVQLVLVLVAASVAGALAYRAIVRRA
jgi:ABC-type transporter Mla subunit MlaD